MNEQKNREITEKNSQRAAKDDHVEKNIFPQYCMIAPTQQDVLEGNDETTVCSERS